MSDTFQVYGHLAGVRHLRYIHKMRFEEDYIYHVYNRGNNQQTIFFSDNDYLLFLNNTRKFIYPFCDILAWCLMPNHFHFLIHSNAQTVICKKVGGLELQQLTYGVKQLLSSYAKSINNSQKRTGNLFQQKTKAKCVNEPNCESYALTAFNYVHQNPWKAKLVNKIEDWQYSSFRDYLNLRNGKLINKGLAKELIDLDESKLYKEAYSVISPELEAKLL